MWNLYRIEPQQIKHHPVNWQKAYRYARMMERGDQFPPVKVHRTEFGQLTTGDGAHRTVAAKMAGLKLLVRTKLNLDGLL